MPITDRAAKADALLAAGKPALTFHSHSEFNKWRTEEIMRRLTARPPWWQDPAVIIVLVAAVLLVSLLIYRRHLSRKRYAAS